MRRGARAANGKAGNMSTVSPRANSCFGGPDRGLVARGIDL
jgi:hypothetical protein